MPLPIHSPLTPPRPTTLAQAVAQARHPRNHATAQLEPQRGELLRLRQTGESVESLTRGLRLLGIEIGHETLRRWLRHERGKTPTRRRKSRSTADGSSAGTPPEGSVAQEASDQPAILVSKNAPAATPAKTPTTNESMPST
jgi:hypothetical protein